MWLHAMKKNKSTTHTNKATKLVLPSNWNYCTSKLLKDLKVKSHSFAHILTQMKILKKEKNAFLINIVSLTTLMVVNLLGHVLICQPKR